MTLRKRTISINFGMGIDGKTDDKLTTKLLTADNAVIRKNGTIEKRLGFTQVGSWTNNSSPMPLNAVPAKVFPFQGTVFVSTNPTSDTSNQSATIANLSTANVVANVVGSWRSQDTIPLGTIRTKQLYESSYGAGQLSFAIFNGSATQTGIAAVWSTTPSASSTVPDVMSYVDLDDAVSVKPYVFTNVNTLKNRLCSLSATSLTVASARMTDATSFAVFTTTALSITPSSRFGYTLSITPTARDCKADIVAIGSKFYFCLANGITALLGSVDPVTGTSVSVTFNASQTPTLMSLVNPLPGTDRIRVLWCNGATTTNIQGAQYSLTLSQITAATSLGLAAASTVLQLEGAEHYANSNTQFSVFHTSNTVGPQTSSLTATYVARYDNTMAAIASVYGSRGLQGCKLIARPFTVDKQPYALVCYSTSASQAIYCCRSVGSVINGVTGVVDLVPVSRALFGLAGGNLSSSQEWLPAVTAYDSNRFYTVARKAIAFKGGPTGSVTVNFGTELVDLNFSYTQNIAYSQYEDTTYLSGGYLSEYDGAGVIEAGFLGAPTLVTVSSTTLGGAIGPASGSATYSMVVLDEFTDRSGQTHKSQPSNAISINASTSTMSFTVVAFSAPSFRDLTRRVHQGTESDGPTQKRSVVYRTASNGTIYYRDSANPTITASVANAFSISISDATLAVGDVVYTQGGVLPNWCPDGCDVLWVHGNRLFCNDPTNPNLIWFSKVKLKNEGFAFAQQTSINVPGAGRVNAGVSLDSNCVVFKDRAIYAFSGNGPDDTGLSGSFSEPALLFPDIGCIGQRNLCRFRDGVVFKSADKGFYLLGRDLQLQYIGADVEDYNSKTVVSSEVVALAEAGTSVEECRFLCSDGTLLTYNYYNGQWTTATLPGCTDAVYSGGKYFVVNPSTTVGSNAKVFQQSLSTYVDAFSNTSVTYAMTIETGWIKTADVQGLQRIWKGNVLGESSGPGAIQLEIGYDFETAYNESYSVAMSSLTAASYTGGATAVMQGMFAPIRQKCNAIRFKITDIPSAGNTSGVFKLTNISLECGVKSGLFKLPATKGI